MRVVMKAQVPKIKVAAAILLGVFILGCGSSSGESTPVATSSDERNPKWATPLDKPGLPNLHRVTGDIYRGAQPLREGFKSLRAMGIKTIINFRNFHSDLDEIKAAGLEGAFQYYDMGMNTWNMTDERAAAFLQVVENKDNHPVFYHCQHGADRTGTMTAVFRIAHQGWTQTEALDEMENGGYGYHEVWTNLINYIKGLETSRVRKILETKVGPPPETAP